MTTETRIYHLTIKSQECIEDILVNAASRSQAIRFAAQGHITCSIPKPVRLVELVHAGVKVADANTLAGAYAEPNSGIDE